jgi:hypothetical protein
LGGGAKIGACNYHEKIKIFWLHKTPQSGSSYSLKCSLFQKFFYFGFYPENIVPLREKTHRQLLRKKYNSGSGNPVCFSSETGKINEKAVRYGLTADRR